MAGKPLLCLPTAWEVETGWALLECSPIVRPLFFCEVKNEETINRLAEGRRSSSWQQVQGIANICTAVSVTHTNCKIKGGNCFIGASQHPDKSWSSLHSPIPADPTSAKSFYVLQLSRRILTHYRVSFQRSRVHLDAVFLCFFSPLLTQNYLKWSLTKTMISQH